MQFNPSVSPPKTFILPPLLAALSKKWKYVKVKVKVKVKVNRINVFLADAL
jgi:hypothetical protein